ncbi:MAG: hypothetical protein IPH07_30735 [Deltaproteobacteria bacterium]|nr:hypothetical protein [Deltaproteobacteria bacterium]MBK8234551.1 hypothetical protein [Deltaproteobacteria bacterium]MBK8715293.1 hypothetical protein [Deltaproteobacteria bacterium]MBP7285004.1 hypothetical protein [Nannocystaceae bacterium]
MLARSIISQRASLACALALALPIASLPAAASAAPRVTPEDGARKRAEAQVMGRDLLGADPAAAGMHYDARASEWGDPVLYLDAADAYIAAAEKDRDVAMAEAAIERGRIALDLLYFALDSTADPNFRIIDTSAVPDLIARANDVIAKAQTVTEDIARGDEGEGEGDATAKPKRERKPINARALFLSGAAVTGLGGAVLGVGAVGLIIGAVNQNRAEDPKVYGSAYDQVATKGERGNLIAGVGLGVGGALVLGGVAMMIAGKVVQKRQGRAPDEKATQKKTVRVAPALNGVSISGRF